MKLCVSCLGAGTVVCTLLLSSCSPSRDPAAERSPHIRAVADNRTPLAKKLAQGKLAPATESGARTLTAAPGNTVLPVEEAEEPDARGVREIRVAAGGSPAPRLSAARFGASRDGPPAKSARLAPAPRTWKRAASRPSFARVYVGDGNALALERMRVTVRIEGPRARTLVDHVFRNPHDRRLEGTFEYPLPAGASVSYYAMFVSDDPRRAPDFFPAGTAAALPAGALALLAPDEAMKRAGDRWGRLREARVVVKERARRAYEEVVRRKIDPALLEYAGGNTFRGRVFPIPPKGYNRVVVAYDQVLDVAGGRVTYRFPLPDCDLGLLHVTATMPKAGVRTETFEAGAGAARRETADRIVYDQAWEKTKGPGGDLVWSWIPADPRVQTIAGDDPTTGLRAFFTRVRPRLPQQVDHPWTTRAVFLLDTSLSEEPDRFHTSLRILREILEQDDALASFNVACFDTGAWWVEPTGWVANDAAGRRRVFDRLDGVLLEGATDLSAALDLVARSTWIAKDGPLGIFLLTDGQVDWGERDAGRMLGKLGGLDARFYCYRTGLSAENLELFARLANRGGGVFNVFTEEMARRAALAHRRPSFVVDRVTVESEGRVRDLVVAGRKAAVYPGGDLLVAGRFTGASSGTLVLSGRLGGEPEVLRFPLALAGRSELAARGWAEIAVQQMLALHHPEVDRLAAAYAQRFRIGSRLTSFLVLERDADYAELGIDEAAAKLRVQDVAAFLDARYAGAAVVSRRVAFSRFLREASERTRLLDQGKDGQVRALFARLRKKDFDLPPAPPPGPLPRVATVPAAYLAARAKDRRDLDLYLDESDRRNAAGEPFGALRALSTIVELEPGRSGALRLVGYRLLALHRPALAAELFDRVRADRPFEPHSYRDLARSLEAAGRPGLAAIYYELLLAGKWDARFHDSLRTVATEEYCHLLRSALHAKQVEGPLADLFGDRLETLAGTRTTANLRVTISWNTDATDVDLWVVEPSGEACGYSHQKTRTGGSLLDDLTSGYGPERYQNVHAPAGDYTILVKYYSPNPNLVAGETHVDVLVTRHAGMADEETERFQVILRHDDQAVEVCRVRV